MEKSSLKICQDFKYLYNQQVICLFCIHYLEKKPGSRRGIFGTFTFICFSYKLSFFVYNLVNIANLKC